MFKKTIDGIEFKEIAIEQIFASNENNPRLSVNEAKDSLKRSIGATLAKHVVLEVSVRPGLNQYVLYRGGNTRLEVLAELRDEWDGSEQNPYAHVKCMVFPWDEEENTILTATENIVRGDLCYAEQARAVSMLKRQYEISNHDISFEAWITNIGVSMKTSAVSISRYLNTDRYITKYMSRLMVVGKAKQNIAIYLLNIRTTVYKLLVARKYALAGIEETDSANNRKQVEYIKEEAERERDMITGAAFTECDDLALDKGKLSEWIVRKIEEVTGSITRDEKVIFVPDESPLVVEFAKRYRLGESEEIGDDKTRNAALILLDTLSEHVMLTANRRTRVLNKLNVKNDLGGFVQLASHLDATGRNMLTRLMKDA